MELANVVVTYDGIRVVARLKVSDGMVHAGLVGDRHPVRRSHRATPGDCIGAPGEAAVAALESCMEELRSSVGVWATEHCGCPVHDVPAVGTLFDLV